MIELHPDDQEEVNALRRELIGWRVFLGKTQKQQGLEVGVPGQNISELERGEPHPIKLPLLSRIAETFRHVITVNLEDIAPPETPEIQTLDAMVSSNPHSGKWLDALVLTLLKSMREELEIPADMMAKKLEIKTSKFEAWESGEIEGSPHLYELMAYARELGGRMTLRLGRVT